MNTVSVHRITPENFQAYGTVVTAPAGRPTSQADDYKFWSDIAHYAIEGETEIGLCTVYQQDPAVLTSMERHLRTPEILIPIDAPFILPLSLEATGEGTMKAFEVHPGEVVVIGAGVWHAACIPVGRSASSYFVIFRRNTPAEDVAKKATQPFRIIA